MQVRRQRSVISHSSNSATGGAQNSLLLLPPSSTPPCSKNNYRRPEPSPSIQRTRSRRIPDVSDRCWRPFGLSWAFWRGPGAASAPLSILCVLPYTSRLDGHLDRILKWTALVCFRGAPPACGAQDQAVAALSDSMRKPEGPIAHPAARRPRPADACTSALLASPLSPSPQVTHTLLQLSHCLIAWASTAYSGQW
ncbi:hypothetical protein BS50DRAFT_351721 [Corynespora cassiicola Philippines]|uniref:Uncharacterized protein n=1 Tax=Corynespora cassiicola Philippines TaxID=1448308 RepID=A0A2T2NR75_CORCC|nr:hypothetical protein BS50DRAFT_351721 [Corynespora cassiicola Philippines]